MKKKVSIIVRKSDGCGAIIAEPTVFYEDKSAFERLNQIKREYMGTDGWKCEDTAAGFTATYEGEKKIELEFSVLELTVHNKYRVEITLSVEVLADGRSQAKIVAEQSGNIIKLDHNQFVSINRQSKVELRVTLEAFGHEHKDTILKALQDNGYDACLVDSKSIYT